MEKSYDWLKKFNKSVTLATEAVIIVLMAIMAVVTIAQVFMRYVMHSPIRWSEELARILMVWVAFSVQFMVSGWNLILDGSFFKIFLTKSSTNNITH